MSILTLDQKQLERIPQSSAGLELLAGRSIFIGIRNVQAAVTVHIPRAAAELSDLDECRLTTWVIYLGEHS